MSSPKLAESTSTMHHYHEVGLYIPDEGGEPIGDCIVEGCGGTVLRFVQNVQKPGESEVTQSIGQACNKCGSPAVHCPDSEAVLRKLGLWCPNCKRGHAVGDIERCSRCGYDLTQSES